MESPDSLQVGITVMHLVLVTWMLRCRVVQDDYNSSHLHDADTAALDGTIGKERLRRSGYTCRIRFHDRLHLLS